MLLYQPIALYWEQGRPEQRQAAEEACRILAQFKARRGEPCQVPDLDSPSELEILVAVPDDVLQEVGQLLGKRAFRSVPARFPDLLAYHQRLTEQLRRFALIYPNQKQLLELWQADLSDYQDAVGAMVEQAWDDAIILLDRVVANLAEHSAAMERVRRQHGLSSRAELDELAWSLQKGRPNGEAVVAKLREAAAEVTCVLEQGFPDPRLHSEWEDLWAPLLGEFLQRLGDGPDLALIPRLEEFFQRHSHWLQRARQRRDFTSLPWWQQLREHLVGWFAGCILRDSVSLQAARHWFKQDFLEWPPADRELRLHYQKAAHGWLQRIEVCLRTSARQQVRELVAFGDLHFDRWLWLASKA